IYYPQNSLKAHLCVEGNVLAYEFCVTHNVPHRHTGKLVVASNAHEEPELLALKKRGEDNGVENLRLITASEIRAREPHIRGIAALEVPSAGILSAEDYVRTFARLAADRGASFVTHARVTALEPKSNAIRATIRIGGEEDPVPEIETVEARCVINA